MKANEFKTFKQDLISNEFSGYIMMCGYLFMKLTNKQVEEIRNLIPTYALDYEELSDGSYKVGNWIFKK